MLSAFTVHMIMTDTKMFCIVGWLAVVGSLAGCSWSVDPQDALARANETNLQRLANLYVAFQTENNWIGPADEAKFKNFLGSYNPKKLTRIGIDPNEIDALFVSERDGQPFKIRYSVVGSMMGSAEPVIFEATGVDGKRLVGFLNMDQREVDENEYQLLWEGKAPLSQPLRNNV